MYGFYYDPTMLLLIPGLLLALWAQIKTQSTFRRYARVPSQRGMTAAQVAQDMLRRDGITDVVVERTAGSLTDHFDPRSNVLRLSEDVYDSTSLAALGVAAHEVGHVMQHQEGYLPLRLRSAVVPVAQIGSYAAWPLFFLGLPVQLGAAGAGRHHHFCGGGRLLPGDPAGGVQCVPPRHCGAGGRRISDVRGNPSRPKGIKRRRAYLCGGGVAGFLQLLRLLLIAGGRRSRD